MDCFRCVLGTACLFAASSHNGSMLINPQTFTRLTVMPALQAPFADRPEYTECERLAAQLADLLAPQSGAYYDVWLDGEKFVSAQMEVRRTSDFGSGAFWLLHSMRAGLDYSMRAGLGTRRVAAASEQQPHQCKALQEVWRLTRFVAGSLKPCPCAALLTVTHALLVCRNSPALAQDPAVTEAREFNGFGTNFAGSPEPIYGQLFLPRKFKIAITVPGDNSVDLLTNDLGIVVLTDEAGAVQGYDLLVGGGMGRTNRRAPRSGHKGSDAAATAGCYRKC